jgi:hypothetical protein
VGAALNARVEWHADLFSNFSAPTVNGLDAGGGFDRGPVTKLLMPGKTREGFSEPCCWVSGAVGFLDRGLGCY